jgi:hypothetical protein
MSMGIGRTRFTHEALVHGILDKEAETPRDSRQRAFHNAGLPEPLSTLIAKVATASTTVTHADIAAVKSAGCSEDEIFELVICAAVGQATRQYEAGLAALAQATANRRRP